MLASRRCPGPFRLAILLAGLPALLAAEPLHVSGRLQIPAETPQGIAGARVDLLPQTGETPLATARTDAAGVFELTAPESGCFRVRMRADGYLGVEAPLLPLVEDLDLTPAPALPASYESQVTSGSPAGEEWVFGVRKPAAPQPPGAPPRLVQGRARDLKGAPVAGALVWSEGDPAIPCVKTGADGGFQIRLPAQSALALRTTAAGFLPSDPRQVAPPGRQGPPLVLTLTPAGAIPGRVVDAAGQPLGGAQITARILDTGFSPEGTWSRADGRFRLSRLPPGKLFELIATHGGFAPASVKADALFSPKPVRIVLERGATVLGKVLDPEGQPVPGAELALTGQSAGKVVSDPTGSFAIAHLGAGRFDLRVSSRGFVTLSVPEIEVPDRAARIDLGALTLDRGAVIEGRVTGPSGAPLPEAEVTPTPAPDPLASGLSVSDIPTRTSTDSEGRFRFEDLRRGARFGLRVEHTGFVQATVPAVEAPTPEPLRIELKPGRSVAGQVKNQEGGPVPQARVDARSQGGFRSGSTDEEGRFRIAGIQPGIAELEVYADGYPLVRLRDLRIPEESDVEGLEIALHKGSVLEVQVLDSGRQPVAGISVSASARIFEYWDESGPFDCETDSKGRCLIGGLDTGPYGVLAQSEKYGLTQGSVEIGPGINRQELVFPSGVLVSGRVSDEADAPVAGATLYLNPTEPGFSSQATSLTDGSFQFSAVRDGAYRLSGSAPGFVAGTAPDEVRIAGQEVRGLALRLSRGATLTGRVLGLDPEALESAWVSASPGADGPPAMFYSATPSSRIDREGRYKITDLTPGEWRIFAHARGRAIQEPLQIAPGAREAVLDLRFPSGYTLTGQVTADRAPLAGARVEASSGSGSFQALTGPDGGFQIPNVPPGSYSVTATDGGMAGTSAHVEVAGDQEVHLDFTTGGLEVVVLAGGSPVALAAVQVADSAHLPGSRWTPTDGTGRLAIPRLTSGAYTVQVQKPGFAPAQVNVEVRPGAVTPVEIELKPLQ